MLFTDVSTDRTVRALGKVGFEVVREGKHVVLSDGTRLITVPRHRRLNPYTLRKIIRSAGLSDSEFKDLLS